MLRNTLLARGLRPCYSVARSIHSSSSVRKDFKLTDIGEGIVQVEVMKWFVKPGDTVKEFDRIVEVQSDKATVEITSRFAGVVKSLAVKEGEQAKVGQVLVVFEDDGNTKSTSIPSAPAMTMDNLDAVEQKATQAVVKQAEAQNGNSGVGDVDELQAINDKVLATPSVRHLARENKIDLRKIKGSGKDGRVMKDDILTFIIAKAEIGKDRETKIAQQSVPKNVTDSPRSLPAAKGAVTIVPITGIKKEMVKTMTASLKIPHLGYMEEVRVDDAMKIIAGKKGVTMLSVLIKAASLALVEYPNLNAQTDPECTELKLFSDHNIGIAMDTPRGLMVPVIHDVRSRSIMDVAKELARLRDLGANGKLGLPELSGGTFTLSNIGSVGGTYASPIIVSPQVAIGAFGRSKRVPVFESATSTVVKEVRIMPISWSADHRVIDGATIAKFCNEFKYLIENPQEILLRIT